MKLKLRLGGQGRGTKDGPFHDARRAARAGPRGTLNTRLRYADFILRVREGERFLGEFSTGKGAMNHRDIQDFRGKCLT